MVVSGEKEKQRKSEVFRLPAAAAQRVQRIAFQASLDEGHRVTFVEILGRALDALERELAAGKAVPRRRGKG